MSKFELWGFIKKNKLWLYLILTTFLFLIRVISFASDYGGIEHDSGWHLGMARNLAERGIFASYTNTLTEENESIQMSIPPA